VAGAVPGHEVPGVIVIILASHHERPLQRKLSWDLGCPEVADLSRSALMSAFDPKPPD